MIVIRGPAQMHKGAHTPATHRAEWLRALQRRRLTPWLYLGEPVPAFVNDARLILRCPNCSAGVAVDRERQIALCRECGAEFAGDRIALPDAATFAAIEAALAVRPELARHWIPGEPVEALERENVEHGLERRRRQEDR